MSHFLRSCLLALVFLNVVFVHITGAVNARWLVPLYALCLAAPLLVRLQGSFTYRLLWNLAVVGIFAILLQDATSTGIRHLLEDGLVLAAFSQVHLLNNLSRKQKPDLLFFNAFLIALVTCFFSQDLTFFLVFMVFVPVLVLALETACVESGKNARPARVQLVVDAMRRSAVALFVTGVAFLFLPRDFDREGFVAAHLEGAEVAEIGFSEEVKLGQSGELTSSNRVVLRASLLTGHAQQVPLRWRGATFTTYGEGGWRVESRVRPPRGAGRNWDRWQPTRPGRWSRSAPVEGPRLRVELSDVSAHRLFFPGRAWQVEVRTPADLMLAHVLADGTARYWGKEDERNEAITYEIAIASRPRRELGGRTEGRPFMLERYRFVRPDQVPEAAKLRTRRIIDRLPLFAAQHEHVEALCRDLAESFEYLLPGVQGAADNLEEFFSGDRGGHCEFFATALAVELRYLRIPCRLVTGYLSNEWDEESRTLTIRSRHAHAWVEVYDPKGGWYFVDPTPAGDGGGGGGLDEGLTSGIGSMLGGFWKGLVRFDGAGRDEALAMLIAFPGALVKSAIERWPLTLALPLLIVLGLRLRRRRALAGLPRAVRDYRRVLERLGLAPEPGETPRELVTRARRGSLARERLEDLQVATLAHESRRYRRG